MTDETATEGAARGPERREIARVVAGIVVILAFIALAALAIVASRSDLSISSPAGAREAPRLPVAPALTDISTPLPMRVVARPAASPPTSDLPAEPAAPVPELPQPPALDPPSGKPCAALGLPAPQQVGGIQNLVRLIPLFGPFSPEAFAMLPAFQPGIEALGPLFPRFEQGLDQLAPVLDAVTPGVQQLSDAGYAAIAPLYGPYRQDVLAAEAQLASFLQPIVASLAQAPGSECLVALEGLLASLQPGAQ